MKLLVCGGRYFADTAFVRKKLDEFDKAHEVKIIITGGATGADHLARVWGELVGVHTAVVPAMWDAHGPAAGPMRNRAMLLLQPDYVIAFPGGKGTEGMVELARETGISGHRYVLEKNGYRRDDF